ncbi:hypothetical protein HLB23_05935 [Nocardia uniformis]|uniref:Uncharacterized protein n=1 Tax=Nocardia uniformis TaxID=53432 RepID=A0A849BRZ1_9NOCA|nr:hypothetical protein [Nocardia uniformis]NNH69412.1 hypothetical protein [Nocardia uniformis]
MKIVVTAPEKPLTVRFEPSGTEHKLAAKDHLVVEWGEPGEPGDFVGSIEYWSDEVVVSFGRVLMTAWDSAGDVLEH